MPKVSKAQNIPCFSVIKIGTLDLTINIGYSLARELQDILLHQEEKIDPSLFAFAKQIQTELKNINSQRIEIDPNAVHFMINPYPLLVEINKKFALDLSAILLDQVEEVKPYVIAFANHIKSMATVRHRATPKFEVG